MSGLALMEVQRALHAKLSGDVVLAGLVNGIYDAVPPRLALPYVMIGDGQTRTLGADALSVTEVDMQIDVWTEASGRKTALTIMNRLFALLHLGTLSLTGFDQVILRCEQADTAILEQGTRIHGTLAVRALVVEA